MATPCKDADACQQLVEELSSGKLKRDPNVKRKLRQSVKPLKTVMFKVL